MNPLALGMQSLRIAQFFREGGENPSPSDKERLGRGVVFLHRALGVVEYVDEGQIEGLEEGAFTEARYVCDTLRTLKKLSSLHDVRLYLSTMADSLAACANDRAPDATRKADLQRFFATVGEALVSEATNGSAVIGVHALRKPTDSVDHLAI
jgi:hypothetical protein